MRHFAPLFLTWRTVDEICCSKGRIQFLPEPIESCVWFCIYLVTVSDLSSIDHFSSEQKKITYSDKFMESSQAFCWTFHLLFGNGSIFFSLTEMISREEGFRLALQWLIIIASHKEGGLGYAKRVLRKKGRNGFFEKSCGEGISKT